ncbi:MAG TPA: lipopolysaccharide transport periplasmic protein LptA [Spongiibacteraceae bacterium]|nr:lipopolysaccharide transport periplasmic protein LptA [Spongiibacteraceae bacterium]
MNSINTVLLTLVFGGAACGVLSGAALALPADSEQPIEVDADRAVRKAELVTYLGNVVINQGSLRIQADKVVVTSQGKQVQRIVASGSPAQFQQQPEPEQPPVHAAAQTIDYNLSDTLIVLTNQASVRQEGSEVQGQRIEYQLETQTVRADSSGQGDDRVRMVLQPQDRPAAAEPEAPAKPELSAEPDAEARPAPGAAPAEAQP